MLDLLACPSDGSHPLLPSDDYAALVCSACDARYPIRQGVVDFLVGGLSGDEQERSLKQSEIGARDAQAHRYDRMLMLRLLSALEIPAVLRALRPMPTDAIFEAGCGTGRLTSALASRCGRLVAADFSIGSLLLCSEKAADARLIAADVCRAPLRPAAFDAVVSCQCIEHLPPEGCSRAIASWRGALKPNGRLVLTAYHHTWWSRLLGRREGLHSGAIYFRRFTSQMLRELLEPHFRVERIRPIGCYVLLASAHAA
jgi:ubiquinone/menaquinone biosynthesis C-methylase UbiE/uncharacterized protein YbaR (Trm112 family)